MLGFSPLSTNPLSAIDDILRLESSALLDSISIIDSSTFIKFFESSFPSIISKLEVTSKNVIRSESDIVFSIETIPSSRIKIPESAVFLNKSEISANYLSLVTSNSVLDVYSKLELNSYLSNSNSAIFSQSTELLTFAKINFFSSSDLPVISSLELFGHSKLPSQSMFSTDVDLVSEVLSRTIGNIVLPISSTFELDQYIKSYIDLNLDTQSNLIFNPSTVSFNSSNFQIVGILSGNISQVNRDIVYYMLYMDKIKPFNLYIAKVK